MAQIRNYRQIAERQKLVCPFFFSKRVYKRVHLKDDRLSNVKITNSSGHDFT